jgi:hypothetical protein
VRGKLFGFRRVLDYGRFRDSIVTSINYMFFETGFERSTYLTYIGFSTRPRNLVNSWNQHWVKFIFGRSKKLFEGTRRGGGRRDFGFRIVG